MDEPTTGRNIKIVAAGAAVGLAYGLAVRYGSRAFHNNQLTMFELMTLGFMFFLPFAIAEARAQ